MSVPGSNLLAQAFAVIGTQLVQYRQFAGRTKTNSSKWFRIMANSFR